MAVGRPTACGGDSPPQGSPGNSPGWPQPVDGRADGRSVQQQVLDPELVAELKRIDLDF
eukprot:SAG22_NODE_477_length_9978_cov_2.807268_2_plen_59_part_00